MASKPTNKPVLTVEEDAELHRLARQIVELVLVRDVPYVIDDQGHRDLDIASYRLGRLLGFMDIPEVAADWDAPPTRPRELP